MNTVTYKDAIRATLMVPWTLQDLEVSGSPDDGYTIDEAHNLDGAFPLPKNPTIEDISKALCLNDYLAPHVGQWDIEAHIEGGHITVADALTGRPLYVIERNDPKVFTR